MPKRNPLWKPDRQTLKAIARGKKKLADKVPPPLYRQCKYCGDNLTWVKEHGRSWTPMDHGTGLRHVCRARGLG